MRWTQLLNADLNLLAVFAVFAEARAVSKAAERLSLSQPAVSRALQRVRLMFGGEDLFLRTRTGYELTAHGMRIQRELNELLPRLDVLLRKSDFDPCVEKASFKIASTDYAFSLLGKPLSSLAVKPDNRVFFKFLFWSEFIYEEVEQGRVDLIFQVNEGSLPNHLEAEVLFRDELVCVVSKKSYLKIGRISLKQYSEAEHVVVALLGSLQTMPDKMLVGLGVKRKFRIEVPYFASAIDAVSNSDLIATVPLRFASQYCDRNNVRLLQPPREFKKFEYLMAWHPRQATAAPHQWLREQVRAVVKNMN